MHQLVSSDSMMIVSVRLVYGERRREVSWHASTRHFLPATLHSVIRVNCGSRKQVLSGFRSSVDGHGLDVSSAPVWNEGIQNAGIKKNVRIRYDEK